MLRVEHDGATIYTIEPCTIIYDQRLEKLVGYPCAAFDESCDNVPAGAAAMDEGWWKRADMDRIGVGNDFQVAFDDLFDKLMRANGVRVTKNIGQASRCKEVVLGG